VYSLADRNEDHKLELQGTREPLRSSVSSPFGEISGSQGFVSHGNEAKC
jgi:hypothetical protein